MPARSLRPCAHPGCAVLTSKGKCEAHQQAVRKASDQQRGKTVERGYDWQWRKLRAAYLAEHPLCQCVECREGKGRLTVAEVVDHIQPIETHPHLRLEWSNLRSMSKEHHDQHTARTRGWGKARGGR